MLNAIIKIFKHRASGLKTNKNLVYTAMSKHCFYFRMHISKFVLEQQKVPLNPFMSFEYFLLDTVDRDLIREANNNLVMKSNELWVFGPISDGVMAEIKMAKDAKKIIKYFKIKESREIIEIREKEAVIE